MTSGLERLQVGGPELSVLSRGSLEGTLESNADDKTEVVLMRLFLVSSHPPPAERAAWESPRERLCWGHLVFRVKILCSRSAQAGEAPVTNEQETGSSKVRPRLSRDNHRWCSAGAEKEATMNETAA